MGSFIDRYAKLLDDGRPEWEANRLADEENYDDYNGCPYDEWN